MISGRHLYLCSSTLHCSTAFNCTMPTSGVAQSGYVLNSVTDRLDLKPHCRVTVGTDCNENHNDNAGCGVKAPDLNSYGPAFNGAGGGWYAMEHTNSSISIWFWSRDSTSVPYDVAGGYPNINTASWGEPTAYYPNTDCDIASSFGTFNILINLTFCTFLSSAHALHALLTTICASRQVAVGLVIPPIMLHRDAPPPASVGTLIPLR